MCHQGKLPHHEFWPKAITESTSHKRGHPVPHFYARPRETEIAAISEGCTGLTVIKTDNQLSLSDMCWVDLTAAFLYTYIFALVIKLCRDYQW